MVILKDTRENHQFSKVWTTEGKILYKDGKKIKLNFIIINLFVPFGLIKFFYLFIWVGFLGFFFTLKLLFISYVPLLTFLLLIFQIVNFTVDFPTFLIAMSIMNGNYNFISRNFEEKRGFENRLKLSKYLTNNINNNGFIYLQETHSSKMETVF